ncbi:MAG: hypothetical protein H7281_04425 [Bacteriovorax sp.]|nr:hypothetical protein [Bacteriovorax sp.]
MLPIIPYLTWLLFSKLGAQFGVPAFYAGATDQAFASNAYLLKLGMNEPWSKILIDSLKKIFITFPLPLFLLIAVQLLSRSKMKVAKFKPILICLIFAFVPYAFWYFSTQAYRYSMPFYLSLIFITMFFLNDIKDSSKKIMIFNSIALFVQIIISFFVLFYSPKINILGFLISNTAIVILITLFVFFIEKNRWKTGRGFILSLILALTLQNDQKYLHQSIGEFVGYMPNKSEWTDIWTTIFNQTGWSYEEAKNKIYYIDHHISQDPELFLRSFNYHKELQKILLSPDGFFVSYSYGNSSRNREGGLVKPQDWLLKQNLHLDIITALKNGEIRLGENISKLNLIIPFWVTNSNKIPKHFHNVGEGYQASEDDKRLAEVPEDQGIKKIGPNTFLFKWNESPDKNSFCSTGAIVNVIKKNKDYQINIKIIGSTISQMTPWVSPAWTQAWISPYLEIMCDTQIKRFIISESVGFRRKYTHNKWDPLFTGNNSIIGPFEKNINFSCNGPITFLRLGRKGSTVDKIRSVKELPPKSLEINLRTYKFI